MDIYEFAVNYPKLYQKIDDEVMNFIDTYQMNGSETLQELDNYVDNIFQKFEQQDPAINEENMVMSQQFDRRGMDRGRHWDWDRGRRWDWDRDHRRRRRDFDLRDLTRIIFLRRLFDRNRF